MVFKHRDMRHGGTKNFFYNLGGSVSWWTLCLFFSLMFLGGQSQPDKNTLIWKKDRVLTWDDFQGKPEKRFAAASTAYDILKTISPEQKKTVTIKIEAVFFKNTSWKKKSWINEQVLAHEQKHFDIVELYARKLRKLISEFKFTDMASVNENVTLLYNKIDKEMDIYQDKYDEETDGSLNGDQQRAWQKKISQEIEELSKFEETTVVINLN